LIQVLGIKDPRPVNAAVAAAKAGRVNRNRRAFRTAEGGTRQRGIACKPWKKGNSQASGLYCALTLSPVSSGELGKMRSPRMRAAGNSEVVVKGILIGPLAWVEDQVRVNPTDPQTDFTAR
jgi:hypothetical protein